MRKVTGIWDAQHRPQLMLQVMFVFHHPEQPGLCWPGHLRPPEPMAEAAVVLGQTLFVTHEEMKNTQVCMMHYIYI